MHPFTHPNRPRENPKHTAHAHAHTRAHNVKNRPFDQVPLVTVVPHRPTVTSNFTPKPEPKALRCITNRYVTHLMVIAIKNVQVIPQF